MSKLKNNKISSKLRKKTEQGVSCWNAKGHIAFSYEFLTDDKQYCFDYFDNNIREHIKARKALDDLLKYLSSSTWLELQRIDRRKRGGFEAIPFSGCAVSIFKNSNLTPDVSVLSFRFGGGSYRLLGYKYPNCHILYILGFDFDYSAYDHGS